MFFVPAFVTLSALVTFASAAVGPKIIVPATNQWWVAQSSNVLTWDCSNSQVKTFGVYLNHSDVKIFVGPLAIFATLENSMCSTEVTQQKVSQPAAPGYTILFTDPVNVTNIYSQSDVFEIKALGSAYPATLTSSSPSGTGTSGNSKSTGTGSNGAFSYKTSLGYGFAAVGALVGLIAA